LLQLSQPGIGTGFVAPAFIFHQSSTGHNQRVVTGVILCLDGFITRR
jgi:hypothetical protein